MTKSTFNTISSQPSSYYPFQPQNISSTAKYKLEYIDNNLRMGFTDHVVEMNRDNGKRMKRVLINLTSGYYMGKDPNRIAKRIDALLYVYRLVTYIQPVIPEDVDPILDDFGQSLSRHTFYSNFEYTLQSLNSTPISVKDSAWLCFIMLLANPLLPSIHPIYCNSKVINIVICTESGENVTTQQKMTILKLDSSSFS